VSQVKTEIDSIDKESWNKLILQFDDATLFQTWSFGAAPGVDTSHIVIKESGEILACCTVNIRRLPFFKIGIADIKWGPLYIKNGKKLNTDSLVHLIRAIKEEYGIKRKCLIKMTPHATGDGKELLKKILESEGFIRNESVRPYRSFRIDLSQSADDLRQNLLQKWRVGLRRAEKSKIDVIEGTGIELYNILRRLAKECESSKNYKDNMDYESYRLAQESLPDPMKIRFLVCEAQGEPVCAVAYSVIGETSIYTLSGTGTKAYALNATHLIQWRMILRAKENGARYFDLGPFNPKLNPGVYHFKRGIAGKRGWEEKFLGEYHGSFSLKGRVAKSLYYYSRFLPR
jgi:lipid II:glycine glycyltransferase (peptidoglycan interpeptide bridge formation enzyme)